MLGADTMTNIIRLPEDCDATTLVDRVAIFPDLLSRLRSARDQHRRDVKRCFAWAGCENTVVPVLDVRLAWYTDGSWCLNTGDVQYDTDHGDACAASDLHIDYDDEDLSGLASYLIDEVTEQVAEMF